MNQSEKVDAFAAAFAAAQSTIKRAEKDAKNPFFDKDYADLGSVMDACKDALNGNGISVIQSPAPSEKGLLALDTVLMHKSGQWVSGQMIMPLGKSDPQGYGSALTYARRYSLAAMVGVCPKDDDAEGATERGNGAGKQQQNRQQQQSRQPDANEFESRIDALLAAREFTVEEIANIKSRIIKKKKVGNISRLPASEQTALITAIESGAMDKFKTAKAA